jgi:hypothetical protein
MCYIPDNPVLNTRSKQLAKIPAPERCSIYILKLVLEVITM